MANHGARAHSKWSASASARNFACSGAPTLIETLDVPDKESEAAAWGTACHQVSEKCLRGGKDAASFIGTTEVTKEHKIEVTEELAETAHTYVDYVRGRLAQYKAETGQDAILVIEEQMSLARIRPPIEGGGTGDAVIYFPLWQLLEVVDLKGGRGVVVEAEGNKQIRTYMLCALLTHPDWAVMNVQGTVVQPRAHHASGRIRDQKLHVSELMEWTRELLDAMKKSAMAAVAYRTILAEAKDPNLAPRVGEQKDRWEAAFLSPGNHCANTFCAAQGICPALRNQVLAKAKVFFSPQEGWTMPENTPDKMMPEQLAEILDVAEMIEGWINAVQAYAHTQAEMGIKIPNYQLVAKQARAKASDEATPEELARLTAMPANTFTQQKLRTITELKSILKTKGWEKIKHLFPSKSSGTNLVRVDKTDRPPVQSKAEKFFSKLD